MVEMPDGKRIAGRRFVALAMWELATTGKVTMPDGAEWRVTPAEWFDAVKWIYAQVDGPPKQALEIGGQDGKAIRVKHEYSDDAVADILRVLAGAGALDAQPEDGGEPEAN